MDPMAMSQGIYGGFGTQGMGMNGMNVGLGFNAGQGAFGGFNGQPTAWNAGQNKFNQNAYGGHSTGMAGEFGINGGYGGYNMPQHQGNFNQMHHQYQNNDFQNGFNGPGFHSRGRGRGRGYLSAGRGRGGFNQMNSGNQANYEPFHHQVPQQIAKQAPFQQQSLVKGDEDQEPQPQGAEGAQKTNGELINQEKISDQQLLKELEPGDAGDTTDAISINPSDKPIGDKSDVVPTKPLESMPNHVEIDQKDSTPVSKQKEEPVPTETFASDDAKEPEPNPNNMQSTKTDPSSLMPPPAQAVPTGPAALHFNDQQQDYASRGRGAGRGSYRGNVEYRGGLRGRGSGILSNGTVVQPMHVHPTPAVDLPLIPPSEPKGLGVEGAPKAPKALREGLPNTGMRGGRGFSIIGRATSTAQARPNGQTRSRRCVTKIFHSINILLLNSTIALPPLAHGLLPATSLIDIVHIVIALLVAPMTANEKKGVTGIATILEDMRTVRIVKAMSKMNHVEKKNQQKSIPGSLLGIIEIMRGKGMQDEAVIARIVLTGSEVENEKGNLVMAESDQDL